MEVPPTSARTKHMRVFSSSPAALRAPYLLHVSLPKFIRAVMNFTLHPVSPALSAGFFLVVAHIIGLAQVCSLAEI